MNRIVKLAIAPAVALFVGVAIGAAGDDADAAAPAPAPKPEVQTVTEEVEVIKEVEVEVVPQACLDALDDADRVIEVNVEGWGYATDAFSAASEFDLDGMETATNNISDLAPVMGDASTAYYASSSDCRDASN